MIIILLEQITTVYLIILTEQVFSILEKILYKIKKYNSDSYHSVKDISFDIFLA